MKIQSSIDIMSEIIYALSSAPGKAGVAIVRISGKNLAPIFQYFTLGDLSPRYAHFKKIVIADKILDEAIVIYFQAPHSFTGEDVIEFHLHGSIAVVKEIFLHLANIPFCRMAEAGEFSKRALFNGKMDITQIEGLGDLLDATSAAQKDQAILQMQGNLAQIYNKWRSQLIEILAFIEAYIDFPDEDLPKSVMNDFHSKINQLIVEINLHLDDNHRGEKLRDGLQVAIIGKPNVGKSSLINCLAGRDIAIVSSRPGTTRDIIDLHLDIAGYPFIISDTAGIRESTDEIEQEGIIRAKNLAAKADIKIIVTDHTNIPLSFEENAIYVQNKIDIDNLVAKNMLPISAKTGEGIDQLINKLKEFAEQIFIPANSPLISRARHRELVTKTKAHLKYAINQPDIILLAEEIRLAANYLGKITGYIDLDEILDKLFTSFCIGK